MLAHLAGDVCQNLVPVGQLYAEHCVWKSFYNTAFDLDDTVFVSHKLTYLLVRDASQARKCPPKNFWDFRSETPKFNPRRIAEILVIVFVGNFLVAERCDGHSEFCQLRGSTIGSGQHPDTTAVYRNAVLPVAGIGAVDG